MQRKRMMQYGPSKSAGTLARSMGVLRIKKVGNRFVPRMGDRILNWGSSTYQGLLNASRAVWLNKPENVSVAISKMASLTKMKEAGVRVPNFTTSVGDVRRWIEEGHKVLARRLDRAYGGRGIVLFDASYLLTNAMPVARLYTMYHGKKHEFRIHVVRGSIIDSQQKRLRHGFPNPDFRIRNYDRGWVFCRDGLSVPQCVKDEAIKAVQALGLDFGAVDVGYNEKRDKAIVYEVNTAPGLVGATLQSYTRAFRQQFLSA